MWTDEYYDSWIISTTFCRQGELFKRPERGGTWTGHTRPTLSGFFSSSASKFSRRWIKVAMKHHQSRLCEGCTCSSSIWFLLVSRLYAVSGRGCYQQVVYNQYVLAQLLSNPIVFLTTRSTTESTLITVRSFFSYFLMLTKCYKFNTYGRRSRCETSEFLRPKWRRKSCVWDNT